MGNSDLPTARAEPRNLAERVARAKGDIADARKRVVANYSEPVGVGMVLVSAGIVVVGCVVATLHHLNYF